MASSSEPSIIEHDPDIPSDSDDYVSESEDGSGSTAPKTRKKPGAEWDLPTFLPVVHACVLTLVSGIVNTMVPEPYMDEVFHIPQAQHYCVQDYHVWDPKITTPPGLYAISDVLITPIGLFTSGPLCTTSFLRSINRIFAIGTYLVLSRLLLNIHTRQVLTDNRAAMTAFALSLFPVGYFYNFLYYTDSGSTFFVLWAYLLAREGRYAYSGMVSAVSVTFRQTNIIWTCFILGISLVQILSSDPKVVQPKKTDSEDKRDQDPGLYNPLTGEIVSVGQIASSITSLITLTLKHMRYVLLRLYSFLLTLTGFIAFVIWNDGIVLGDRANHVAGLHFPQLFYFTAFTAFFAVPALLSGDVLRRVVVGPVTGGIGRLAALLGTGMAMFFLIDHFTVEHPFLLSDNRHYSFYVWKNIYRRHPLARYALIPGYIGAGWVLIQALAKTLPLLNLLIYITAVGLNLVPSPLLEFRYFIIPFIVYMVHAPVPNNTRLGVLFMMYVAVNFWTLYMFMRRGFEWESEPGRVQRFMW